MSQFTHLGVCQYDNDRPLKQCARYFNIPRALSGC